MKHVATLLAFIVWFLLTLGGVLIDLYRVPPEAWPYPIASLLFTLGGFIIATKVIRRTWEPDITYWKGEMARSYVRLHTASTQLSIRTAELALEKIRHRKTEAQLKALGGPSCDDEIWRILRATWPEIEGIVTDKQSASHISASFEKATKALQQIADGYLWEKHSGNVHEFASETMKTLHQTAFAGCVQASVQKIAG